MPVIERSAPKRIKLRAAQRRQTILALQLAGKTQDQIAAQLGVNRATIVRDLQQMRPAQSAVVDIMDRAQQHLEKHWPVEERIDTYVNLGKNAKNETVQLASAMRCDDIAGIVTQKELVRTRRDEQAQPASMFMLPPGAHVSVTVTSSPPPQRNITPVEGRPPSEEDPQ